MSVYRCHRTFGVELGRAQVQGREFIILRTGPAARDLATLPADTMLPASPQEVENAVAFELLAVLEKAVVLGVDRAAIQRAFETALQEVGADELTPA